MKKESKDIKREKRREVIQIVSLILIFFFIGLMVLTLTTLIKNKNIIQKNPFEYGMNQMNFTSCACKVTVATILFCECLDVHGKLWIGDGGRFETQIDRFADIGINVLKGG